MPRRSLADDSPFLPDKPRLHTQMPQSPSSLGPNRVPASPQPVTQIPSSAAPPRPASGSAVQMNAVAAAGTAGFSAPFTMNAPNPHSNTEMMLKPTPASRVPAATIERREKAWDFTSIDAEDADICLTPMVPDVALESHRGVSGSHVSAIRGEGEEGLQPREARSREAPTTESQQGLSAGMNDGIHKHCGSDAQGQAATEVEAQGMEGIGIGEDGSKRNAHKKRASEEAVDVMKKLGWDADAFGAFFDDDVDGLFAPLNGN
ncbi:unnamed protein product [Closterium sp. Yama58-4]|nr:unnamed protein product [Closterium sp. Yama58-4]